MAELTAARNNALPYPVYALPWVVVFPLLDADGDPISPSSPDSERSLNGDTFADCTNEAVEIATSTGVCYLILTAAEMTADIVAVRIQSTGAKTTILTLYPRKLAVLSSGTCQGSNDTGDIILASGDSAVNDIYNGCLCVATIDTVVECRIINDYVGSNKTAEVSPAWVQAQPDSNDTYIIYLPEGRNQVVDLTHIAGSIVNTSTAQLGVNVVNVQDVVDGVLDEDMTGHQTQGTLGQAIGDPAADTNTIFKAVVTDSTGVTVGTDTATLLTRMGTPSDLGGGATLSGNLSDIEGQTDDIGAAGAGLTALATAANLSTLMTRVGTPSDLGGGATVAANLSDIEGQTDDIGAAGAGLTALATAANLSTLMTRVGTPSDLGGGATVAANLSDIESQTDDIGVAGAGLSAIPGASDPWNTSLPGAYASGKAGYILGTYLDAAISGVGGATGPGAISHTHTETVDGNPAESVAVWVTTDLAGTNTIAGTLYTNSSGQVTFTLNAGTFYLWRQKDGVNFTNPVTITVS